MESPDRTLTAIDIASVQNAARVWSDIVDSSEHAWIWHTFLFREFDRKAGAGQGARDLSFFVKQGETMVGVVPLVMLETVLGDFRGKKAAYYSGFLPWPCFRAGLGGREALEDFAFTELERRAREVGAGYIVVRLTPRAGLDIESTDVERIITQFRYVNASLNSHVAAVSKELLKKVRSRYDYKKFSPLFKLSVAENTSVTDALEETYFQLHIKDAGGQFRPRESYRAQADFARKGEGFYVVATHKETGTVVGMALISVYKGAAYYGSVAIDPEFQKLCVGYQLQCHVIEELLRRGIKWYDLGPAADIPTLFAPTSKKKLGISHFKEKFSGEGSRPVYQVEKFLDEGFLHAWLGAHEVALKEYFGL